MYNRPAIEQAPLQVYSSALCFAPAKSVVRKQFESSHTPKWIQELPIASKEWSATLGTLEGHSDRVSAIAFAPDGKRLVSSSKDRTIRVWDAISGQALAVLTGHTLSIETVVFAPDSRHLASGGTDGNVCLWDIESGEVQATLEGHEENMRGLAFSFNGNQLLSGSDDRTVRLWDVKSGGVLITISHSSGVTGVAFSPNGKWLAFCDINGTVYLRDAASGEALATLNSDTNQVNYDRTVVFSPSSKQILSYGIGPIKTWDAESGKPLATLQHNSDVSVIAFSPDGKLLAAACEDETFWLWDAHTGEALTTIHHSDLGGAIAFSPDSKLLALGCDDGGIWLWDVQLTGCQQRHGGWGESSAMLQGHSDEVISIIVSPNGKQLASTSKDTTICLWDAESGQALGILKGHTKRVIQAVFSKDSKLIASCSYDGTVRLWDLQSGQTLAMWYGDFDRDDWKPTLAISPDNKQLASASNKRRPCLWSTEPSKALITLKGHSGQVLTFVFSPDGQQLASGSLDQTVRLWDTKTGETVVTFRGQKEPIWSLTFSIDGKRIASGSVRPEAVCLWDVESGSKLATFKGHSCTIDCIAFSLDGKYIASASCDETVRLWDAHSGETEEILELGVCLRQLSFSNDGSYLDTDRGTLRLNRGSNPSLIRKQEQVDLFVSDQWIMAGQHKLLWLPVQYRMPMACVTVKGQNVFHGHNSGQITMIRLDLSYLDSMK